MHDSCWVLVQYDKCTLYKYVREKNDSSERVNIWKVTDVKLVLVLSMMFCNISSWTFLLFLQLFVLFLTRGCGGNRCCLGHWGNTKSINYIIRAKTQQLPISIAQVIR